MNKRVIVCAVAVALTAGFTASASATKVPTAPGGNTLKCFDGTTDTADYYVPNNIDAEFGGHCILPTSGSKGAAILDLSNATTARDGDYAGVYVEQTTLAGATLGSVTQLGYQYVGTKVPTLGDLSLNLPVDENGDNSGTDNYAFVDAANCPGANGVVSVIGDPTCGVVYGGVLYSNWSAFAAAFPTATILSDIATGVVPFIIAERTPTEDPFSFTVSNVKLGKGGSLPGKKH